MQRMETEKSNNCRDTTCEKKNFICGVIEGFYGRPWTTEQRKDLFRKLKKWGMDSYVYAPKDDYKHRAYWRELYTVEEADHLSSLIAAAKEHGIMFYYALSPGLDMTYSSQKEIQTLKRKLDQVSQFGCEAFALLFDDIESELSKADKEVFQTFANAQVSVTNDIYTHLGNPKFLFCPTQYCSTRAVPTVVDSEYLNTLGSRLNHDIDIMWTGNKVISKIITPESIQQITEVLRRPPVIWDNLHANDYDQKRVFLGPYCGRSPELIPHLRGVMTNPNCEFHANTIAIHTLASWSKCTLDIKLSTSFSADVKLENENEDGTCTDEVPDDCMLKNVYHPRVALKNAIAEWLPEFFIDKVAWGPLTKPQPQVTMVMPIIPIIPSINTCMSLTTTTTTTTTSKTVTVPEVNTTQLQAFADVCSTVNSSAVNPISNPIMNSLVMPTKVVTNDEIVNPISTTAASNIELPKKVPVSIVSVPIMNAKTVEDINEEIELENEIIEPKATDAIKNVDAHTVENNDIRSEVAKDLEEDVNFEEKPEETEQTMDTQNLLEENNLSPLNADNEPMECSSSVTSQISPRDERKVNSEDVVMADTTATEQNNCMQVESSEPSPMSHAEIKEEEAKTTNGVDDKMTAEDLNLLCDLFYLPFEHGSRGLRLLNEFNWLKANANVLLSDVKRNADSVKPEVTEWVQRAEGFTELCSSVQYLLKKVASCANKEICFDLFSYVWDVAGALMLLSAFIKWLALRHFPPNMYTFTEGTYTWFSKGWKETFMSGDQEPWVFRGGLIADIQRLMPVDSGNDLFVYKHPDAPTNEYHVLRPYTPLDESALSIVCTRCYLQMGEHADDLTQLPATVRELIADSCVGAFITHSPEMCIVAQDSSNAIVGYAAAALDINLLVRNLETLWIPAMTEKYAISLLDNNNVFTNSEKLNQNLAEMIKDFHNFKYDCPTDVISLYPAVLTTAVLGENLLQDQGIIKRLLIVILAALRASGCFGVHVRLAIKDTQQTQYYQKLGFNEIYKDNMTSYVYLGRRF